MCLLTHVWSMPCLWKEKYVWDTAVGKMGWAEVEFNQHFMTCNLCCFRLAFRAYPYIYHQIGPWFLASNFNLRTDRGGLERLDIAVQDSRLLRELHQQVEGWTVASAFPLHAWDHFADLGQVPEKGGGFEWGQPWPWHGWFWFSLWSSWACWAAWRHGEKELFARARAPS